MLLEHRVGRGIDLARQRIEGLLRRAQGLEARHRIHDGIAAGHLVEGEADGALVGRDAGRGEAAGLVDGELHRAGLILQRGVGEQGQGHLFGVEFPVHGAGGEDGVGVAQGVGAARGDGDIAAQMGRAGDRDEVGRPVGGQLHQIGAAGSLGVVAGHVQCADGVAGGDGAASIHHEVAHRAGAAEGAGVRHRGVGAGEVGIHLQRAAKHGDVTEIACAVDREIGDARQLPDLAAIAFDGIGEGVVVAGVVEDELPVAVAEHDALGRRDRAGPGRGVALGRADDEPARGRGVIGDAQLVVGGEGGAVLDDDGAVALRAGIDVAEEGAVHHRGHAGAGAGEEDGAGGGGVHAHGDDRSCDFGAIGDGEVAVAAVAIAVARHIDQQMGVPNSIRAGHGHFGIAAGVGARDIAAIGFQIGAVLQHHRAGADIEPAIGIIPRVGRSAVKGADAHARVVTGDGHGAGRLDVEAAGDGLEGGAVLHRQAGGGIGAVAHGQAAGGGQLGVVPRQGHRARAAVAIADIHGLGGDGGTAGHVEGAGAQPADGDRPADVGPCGAGALDRGGALRAGHVADGCAIAVGDAGVQGGAGRHDQEADAAVLIADDGQTSGLSA